MTDANAKKRARGFSDIFSVFGVFFVWIRVAQKETHRTGGRKNRADGGSYEEA